MSLVGTSESMNLDACRMCAKSFDTLAIRISMKLKILSSVCHSVPLFSWALSLVLPFKFENVSSIAVSAL